MIKIEVTSGKLEEIKDKCLAIAFFQNRLNVDKALMKLNKSVNRSISSCIKSKQFKGEEKEIKTMFFNGKVVALVGMGNEKNFDNKKLMNAIGNLSRHIRSLDLQSFSFYFNSLKNSKFNFGTYLEKTSLAVVLSLYHFTKYKTQNLDEIKSVDKATIIVDKKNIKKANEIVNKALIYGEAVIRTRDLVNTPPNVATPEYIARYSQEIAKKGKLKCIVLDDKRIAKLGMGCLMAVAQASVNKARMVLLEYRGSNDDPIVLVGKGITFDTGGINAKPANYMVNMKDDKAGACSVINVLEACSKMGLKVHVVGVAVLAENSIGGNAYKPDDVLRSYSGKTVEIVHTDAEGRLVLADGLSYSLKYRPKAIVDIATLTGASVVALGTFASPVLGNDEELVSRLIKSGRNSLDKVWELPLWEEYDELIKSDIADVKHLNAESEAGVIVGAAFLKNFVEDAKWAHIDIGGTVWSKKDNGYVVKGATGFGVLLLLDFLSNWRK